MARALGAALALVLLVPAVAVAEDEPDSAWPTAYEVRRELQGIGYEFAFTGLEWHGGREERIDPTVRVMDLEGGTRVWVSIPEYQWSWDWWVGRTSAPTAAMEVADFIIDDWTDRMRLQRVFLAPEETGCWRLAVDDGTVEAGRGDDGTWEVIFLPPSAEPLCPDAQDMPALP